MADAWWVVFILFLKNMFSWYTLMDTGPYRTTETEKVHMKMAKLVNRS